MVKIAAYLLVGIGVGLGLALWQGTPRSESVAVTGLAGADRSSLDNRLSELETALTLERYERQALAEELEVLRAAFTPEVLADVGVPEDRQERAAGWRGVNGNDGDARELIADQVRDRFPNGFPQTPEERELFQRQRQLDNFVAAGFSVDRAQYIMERSEELEMEALRARYEATQNGASSQEVANLSPTGLLREELGDADYEKYLQGTGRPTTINVREVLQDSPAQSVGLQAGDQIVAYNGQRVFDIGELNELTFEAKPGQVVALEVERNGQTMQFYVESGPIGISGGGRSTRRAGRGR